jgi:tripartite-type tricarboxylate transporter receptor subunit TctC
MHTRRSFLSLSVALLAAGRAMAQAPAGAFPNRPIRLVIPFTPGGSNDIVGRLIAEAMGTRLGQNIVVENRGGAGGVLGNDAVAKALPADGHTLLLGGSGSFVISSLVQPRLPYDITTSFAPVGFLGLAPNVITVNPAVRATNLAELRDVARAAAKAGQPLSYGSPGVGTTGHALGAMIGTVLDVELQHVPYRGTGPALSDTLSGNVQILTNAIAPLEPHIRSGGLRAIAVAGKDRSNVMPEIPTSFEQGFPELDSATWYGLLATGGTPPDRVARLHVALNDSLADPEIRRRLLEAGVEVQASPSPADFARTIAEERERWAVVVRRAGMRVE